MSAAKTTTDHDEIREWVEARGGSPARVKRTGRRAGGDPGILRIDFPGYSGEQSLEQIDWDEWFEAFEKNNLAFLYQDKVAGGRQSRFSKLVERPSRSSRGTRTRATTKSPRAAAAKRSTSRRASPKRATTRRAAPKKRSGTSVRTPKKRAGSSAKKRAVSRRG